MPNRPRMVLTWRLLLLTYILPLALVWGGFVITIEGHNDTAEQFRRDSLARDLASREREQQDCLKSRLNAEVNLAQNQRLEDLLDAAIAGMRGAPSDGGLFRLAIARAKEQMDKENAALRLTASATCGVRRAG
jgi:hypothetical protein